MFLQTTDTSEKKCHSSSKDHHYNCSCLYYLWCSVWGFGCLLQAGRQLVCRGGTDRNTLKLVLYFFWYWSLQIFRWTLCQHFSVSELIISLNLTERQSEGGTDGLCGLRCWDVVKQPLQPCFHIDTLLRLQGPKISHRANSDRAPAAIDPSRFHAADWSEAISVPQTVCVLLGSWQRVAAETSHCWLTVWTPDIEAESIHNVMLQSPLICLFSLHLAPRLWTAAQSAAFFIRDANSVELMDSCSPAGRNNWALEEDGRHLLIWRQVWLRCLQLHRLHSASESTCSLIQPLSELQPATLRFGCEAKHEQSITVTVSTWTEPTWWFIWSYALIRGEANSVNS